MGGRLVGDNQMSVWLLELVDVEKALDRDCIDALLAEDDKWTRITAIKVDGDSYFVQRMDKKWIKVNKKSRIAMITDRITEELVLVKKCCWLCRKYHLNRCKFANRIYAPRQQMPCNGEDFELLSELKV